MRGAISRDGGALPHPVAGTARPLFAAAIALAAGLALLHGVWLFAAVGPASWLPLLAGLAAGVLAADGVSGLVHWGFDTWGGESTPWLGRGIIRAFREHHLEPRAMLDHDWIEAHGETAAPSALCLLAMTAPACQAFLQGHAGLYAFLWSLCVCGALANLTHRWAHAPSPPVWVRRLQRAGLILSPVHHARHHRVHTRAYCTLTGWSNAGLDRLGVWRALERSLSILTGALPRARESQARSSER